jgi:hypothetical protein
MTLPGMLNLGSGIFQFRGDEARAGLRCVADGANSPFTVAAQTLVHAASCLQTSVIGLFSGQTGYLE